MKELHVTVSVRNNLLKARREELGLSAPRFAKACGASYGSYIELETLRASPLRELPVCARPACDQARLRGARLCGDCGKKYGQDPGGWPAAWEPKMEWRAIVKQVAAFLALTPEELFPDSIMAIQRPKVAFEADVGQLAEVARLAALMPDEAVEHRERRLAASEALKKLSANEQKVLALAYGDDPLSMADIADRLGVCRARVFQVRDRALRKLRHPSVSKTLRSFLVD